MASASRLLRSPKWHERDALAGERQGAHRLDDGLHRPRLRRPRR
jgi:hypothetical protein